MKAVFFFKEESRELAVCRTSWSRFQCSDYLEKGQATDLEHLPTLVDSSPVVHLTIARSVKACVKGTNGRTLSLAVHSGPRGNSGNSRARISAADT